MANLKLPIFKKICSFILIICFLLATSTTPSFSVLEKEVTKLDTILEKIVSGIYDWDCSGITFIPVYVWPSSVYIIWLYRHPALLIEAVNAQYDSAILNLSPGTLGGVLSSLLSGPSTTPDEGVLQFNEVHIYGFDWDYMCGSSEEGGGGSSGEGGGSGGEGGGGGGGGSGGCMGGIMGDKKKILCVGKWGPMYPRSGMSIHHLEPVGSALNMVRALDQMLTKEGKESKRGEKQKEKQKGEKGSKTRDKVSEYLNNAALPCCSIYCSPVEDDILKFYFMSELGYIDWHFSLMESISHFGELAKSIRCIYAKHELVESKSKEKEGKKTQKSTAILGKPQQWEPSISDSFAYRLQYVYPGEGNCMLIPDNPKDWMTGQQKVSKDGIYVWCWWRYTMCIGEWSDCIANW